MKKTWTEEEEYILKQNYSIMTLRELSLIFKRSYSAISRKAYLLEVNKYKNKRPRNLKFDVCLNLTPMQFRVHAKCRTEAWQKAIKKLKHSLQLRNDFGNIVISTKSTIKRTLPNENN